MESVNLRTDQWTQSGPQRQNRPEKLEKNPGENKRCNACVIGVSDVKVEGQETWRLNK